MLERDLLITYSEAPHPVGQTLADYLDVRGSYNPLQFALRLSPQVHQALSSAPKGVCNIRDLSFEQVQAFSTYLHETIHWWQHCGSTAGLFESLAHPLQTHSNLKFLREFLGVRGAKKSILKYCLAEDENGVRPTAGADNANVIVNNFMDIEFFSLLRTNPTMVHQVVKSPYFECIGHGAGIAYSNVVGTLSTMFDGDNKFLPDPRAWESAFEDLRTKEVEGFYYGSPINISPIGLFELFEGQARFSQLQYLHFGSSREFSWDDAKELGMLADEYVSAFKAFLKLTDSEWPETIGDALVALFLATIDMAINPAEGFPKDIYCHETFITDTDPGMRFVFFCSLIKNGHSNLKTLVKDYSREEYLAITGELSGAMLTYSPLDAAATVASWAQAHAPIGQLIEEDRTSKFREENLAIRLIFSRYVKFCRDKERSPQFFCWPGAWMAGERICDDGRRLFEGHEALFVNKMGDNGIYPVLRPGVDQKAIKQTFDDFYNATVLYDLTKQWMIKGGSFQYGYKWLSEKHSDDAMAHWAKANFERMYGVNPDAFEILP